MNEVLALCAGVPVLQVARGTTLIEEGVRSDRLFVLQSGAFEVVRNGVRVIEVGEPGAFLGEISALLESPPTASVVALADSVVHVFENASATVRSHPALTCAIARLLARRLGAVTAYLVDIKRQYGDTHTHLALMDEVLGQLVSLQPGGEKAGSERSDVPDY